MKSYILGAGLLVGTALLHWAVPTAFAEQETAEVASQSLGSQKIPVLKTVNNQTDEGVVRAPFRQMADNIVNKTNKFVEDNFLDTTDYSDQGLKYDALNSCLSNFSCVSAKQQSLINIIQYTLSTSPKIIAEQARYNASASMIKGAHWAFWPKPTLSVRKRSSDDKYIATLGIEQPLWTGGRLTAGLDNARAEALVAHSTIGISQLDLAVNIIRQYSSWYSADQKTKIWDSVLSRMDGIMARINRLHDAGAISTTLKVQAESKYGTTLADSLSVKAASESTLAYLSQLAGTQLKAELMNSEDVLIPNLSLEDVDLYDERLAEKLASNSPYLIKAKAEIALALAKQRVQKSSIMPDIFLTLQRDQIRHGGFDNRIYVGARSNFDSGLSYGAKAEASALEVLAARRSLEAEQRELRQQIGAARELFISSLKSSEALKDSIDGLEKYYASVNRQFIANGKSSYEVLTAAYDIGLQRSMLADSMGMILSNAWQYNLLLEGFSALND